MTNAMSSYLSMCGNELVNAARLKAYVDSGVKPTNFDIMVPGCDGLDAIVAAVGEEPPPDGYHLPELDPAPWYDVAIPESQNFAGLLVTEVTISAPYARSTTGNIGIGQTLGRLKLQGRQIVIHGWLVGRTCCATRYGLSWLSGALGGTPCAGGIGCGGCTMEFLDCCPVIGEGEGDFLNTDGGIYVRPSPDSEYGRATDFFRRMNDVGITDGPNVISQKGSSCGCGGSPLLEVEFTLATSSPYFNTFGLAVLDDFALSDQCDEDTPCDFTWVKIPYGEPVPVNPGCPEPVDCLEDPSCPPPAIPPQVKMPWNRCACAPMKSFRVMAETNSDMKWRTSTLNIDVFSGSSKLKNLVIRMWRNPDGLPCDDESFTDCNVAGTFLISYIPPNSHFILSGENRTVTITCDGNQRNAAQNVTTIDGLPFQWPDLNCGDVCIHADFDCGVTALDATLSIFRIDRDL